MKWQIKSTQEIKCQTLAKGEGSIVDDTAEISRGRKNEAEMTKSSETTDSGTGSQGFKKILTIK